MLIYYKTNQYQKKKKEKRLENLSCHIAGRKRMDLRLADDVCVS